MLEEQGEKFPYSELAADGGIARSVQILEGSDEEQDAAPSEDEERIEDREPRRERGRGEPRGGFRTRGRGRFGRCGRERGRGGVSGARMDTYFAHRH
jgi:hypothetical protein